MTYSNDEKQKMNFNYNFSYPEVAFQAGFRLRQFKDGELDWRLLGNVEVDKILREQNVEQLDKMLQHLAEAPLAGMLDSHILDSGIAKYFMLSQFALQYLLFCRNFLDETLAEIRQVYAESQADVAFLRKSLSEANREILQLHKKITQIEAIREVIYPCHLCTKNFINNESLNLHLSRKHNKYWSSSNTPTSYTTTTASQLFQQHAKISTVSTSENDMELIKRVKLELEIKHLKERLNLTEQEVRRRHKYQENTQLTETSATELTGEELIVVSKPKLRTKGIQCNLAESKEQSVIYSVPEEQEEQDYSEDEHEAVIEIESGTSNEKLRGDHDNLMLLEEKILNFDEWRREQVASNIQNISEINDKLKEITIALEYVKNHNVIELPKNVNTLDTKAFEILENQLTQKITEIGNLSSEKIQQIILHMEETYNKKLHHLEEDIKRANQVRETAGVQVTRIPKLVKVQEQKKASVARTDEMPSTSKQQLQTESISESNKTFIKTESLNKQTYKKQEAEILSDDEDNTTDISDGMSSESESALSEDDKSNQSDSSSSLELKPSKPREKVEHLKLKTMQKQKPTEKIKKSAVPKLITRKDVKRMSNKRMAEFDCNLQQKTLPGGSMKKVTQKLNDRRIQEKHKYPSFYVTRNRIKKYVDRLCSKKPDVNVEQVLKDTQPVHPSKPPRKSLLQTATQLELSQSKEESVKKDLDDSRMTATSTPKSIHEQSDFRERLERILASPIHKPGELKRTDDVDVKSEAKENLNVAGNFKPLPLPRKRVMFNTRHAAEGLQHKQE